MSIISLNLIFLSTYWPILSIPSGFGMNISILWYSKRFHVILRISSCSLLTMPVIRNSFQSFESSELIFECIQRFSSENRYFQLLYKHILNISTQSLMNLQITWPGAVLLKFRFSEDKTFSQHEILVLIKLSSDNFIISKLVLFVYFVTITKNIP